MIIEQMLHLPPLATSVSKKLSWSWWTWSWLLLWWWPEFLKSIFEFFLLTFLTDHVWERVWQRRPVL